MTAEHVSNHVLPALANSDGLGLKLIVEHFERPYREGSPATSTIPTDAAAVSAPAIWLHEEYFSWMKA